MKMHGWIIAYLLLCFLYLCESGLMFSGRNAINSDSDTESTDFDLPPRILPWYFPPPQVPAPLARSPRPPEWLDRTRTPDQNDFLKFKIFKKLSRKNSFVCTSFLLALFT